MILCACCLLGAVSMHAQTNRDSLQIAGSYAINEVVVTGARSETDVRHLPMTVSVVGARNSKPANKAPYFRC